MVVVVVVGEEEGAESRSLEEADLHQAKGVGLLEDGLHLEGAGPHLHMGVEER